MGNFVIKEYGRTELAVLYSPNITPQAAWRKLKLWISLNTRLQQRLDNTGYNPMQCRTFTPAQVLAIAEELGDP